MRSSADLSSANFREVGLMDPSCLQYCMTDAQRDHFEQQGYLIVEDALDNDMLGRLLEAGDRVDAQERTARGFRPPMP